MQGQLAVNHLIRLKSWRASIGHGMVTHARRCPAGPRAVESWRGHTRANLKIGDRSLMVNLQLSKVLHSWGPLSPCGTCRTRYSKAVHLRITVRRSAKLQCIQLELVPHVNFGLKVRLFEFPGQQIRVDDEDCGNLVEYFRINFLISLFHFDQNWFHLRKHSVHEVPNFLLPCIKVSLSAHNSE